MITKRCFCVFLFLIYCFTLPVSAQTDSSNWEKLNLNSTTIAGAKVYYDKSFEPNLPFFEKVYKEVLSKQNKANIFESKEDQILSDLNSILGIDESPDEIQRKSWDAYTDIFSSIENMTFYLVKQSTTKDFLRAGGKLPNFAYNKVTDMAEYNPNFTRSSKNIQDNSDEFAFPIKSAETFENDVSMIFRIFQEGLRQIFHGIMIHEIVEISILKHVKQTDPYWRWFTDGFSEAITYELLKKHIDTASAQEYLKSRDIDEFSDLKKEINLRYWMSGQFCLLLDDIPTEEGSRFNLARYAYAAYEARRLIDGHGIDCIAEILDEITAKESRDGSDLLETIKNVTGEDMNTRLNIYQDFKTKQEGVQKYSAIAKTSFDNKDYEQMADALFRLHDLRFPSDNQEFFNDYRNVANCLFRMGLEKDADLIMTNCINTLSNPGSTNGRTSALEAFAIYALETGNPLKAQKFAEELLETKPNNGPATTIKMIVYMENKQFRQARELAQKVINRSKSKDSPDYQIAAQILAIDPNQVEVIR